MANLLTLERDSAHAVNYLTPRTLNLKEITDPIKRLIYIVNTKGEILSIRDYKGNILAKDGSYIDALESDVYRRWKAKHDASLEK